MAESPGIPQSYRVVYSERVREALRNLIARTNQVGRTPELLAALKELDHRLHLYPQFGQPLRDSKLDSTRIWIGVVAPLVAQYVLDEEHHIVTIVVPILPLLRSGF
jgi:hypothetical protein